MKKTVFLWCCAAALLFAPFVPSVVYAENYPCGISPQPYRQTPVSGLNRQVMPVWNTVSGYLGTCTPFLGSVPPMFDQNEPTTLGNDTIRFKVYEDPDCYDVDKCSRAIAEWQVTDDYYCTQLALENGTLAISTDFDIDGIFYGPMASPNAGDGDFCYCGDGVDWLSIGPDVIILYQFRNLTNPGAGDSWLMIEHTDTVMEPTHPQWVYSTKDVDSHSGEGCFFKIEWTHGTTEFPVAPYTQHSDWDFCSQADFAVLTWYGAQDNTDMLKMLDVAFYVPLDYGNNGTDQIESLGPLFKTEMIQLDITLKSVQYDYPWCPTQSYQGDNCN